MLETATNPVTGFALVRLNFRDSAAAKLTIIVSRRAS